MFLSVIQALLAHILAVGEHVIPILYTYQRVEQFSIIADGVESTHNAAHAGACHDVDRDACTFNHFQGTDVCHTFGATTAEYNCYFLSGRYGVLAPYRCGHQEDGH